MTWDRKNLIEIDDLSRENIERLYDLADIFLPYSGIDKSIPPKERKPLEICKGKLMKLWFGEPSTRTYGSFEAAMIRLGGNAQKFDEDTSGLKKKESIKHTVRILSGQCDILVDRHRDPRHIHEVVKYSLVSTINGGNGSHQHPTQTLVDLYTCKKTSGKIDGSIFVIFGDLKYGRTTHSLIRGAGKFDNIEVHTISPPGLEMPKEHADVYTRSGNKYYSHVINMKNLEDKLEEIKANYNDTTRIYLYATRIQDERISWLEKLIRGGRYRYQLTKNPFGLLLHPLPIATDTKYGPEIATELDEDENTIYFQQADWGIPVRMALIATMFGYEENVLKLK